MSASVPSPAPSLPILKNEANWIKRTDLGHATPHRALGQVLAESSRCERGVFLTSARLDGRLEALSPLEQDLFPRHPGVSCTPRRLQHELSTPRKENNLIS